MEQKVINWMRGVFWVNIFVIVSAWFIKDTPGTVIGAVGIFFCIGSAFVEGVCKRRLNKKKIHLQQLLNMSHSDKL